MRNEQLEKKPVQTGSLSQTVRLEVNLLTFPLFTLDKDKAGKPGCIQCHIQKDDRKIEWLVTSQDIPKELEGKFGKLKYGGLPGPFDKDIFFAIMWDIETLSKPVQNPYEITSWSRLLKLARKAYKYENVELAKNAVKRMTLTTVHTFNAYLIKETGKYRTREEIFRPFMKAVFTGEQDEKGNKSESNFITIDDYLLSNINNRFVKPIDYEFYMGLKRPGARRLFEILDPKFFAVKKSVNLRYSTQCQLFPCERQAYLSDAKKIVDRFCEDLYKKGYLSDVEWEKTEDKKDWLINYYPGKIITGHDTIKAEYEDLQKSEGLSRAERFKNFFTKKYSQKFNKKPYISKKDEDSIAGLISVFSDDDLKNLVLQFFRSSDSFITSSSYAISIFSSAGAINKLNIELSARISEDEEKRKLKESFLPPSDEDRSGVSKEFIEILKKHHKVPGG